MKLQDTFIQVAPLDDATYRFAETLAISESLEEQYQTIQKEYATE